TQWNALRTMHGCMLVTAECTLICVPPPRCQDGSTFCQLNTPVLARTRNVQGHLTSGVQ
ncbi:hypothetical protein PISMIDRAFT_672901, partial [Pisolithus microcarpus 441]